MSEPIQQEQAPQASNTSPNLVTPQQPQPQPQQQQQPQPQPQQDINPVDRLANAYNYKDGEAHNQQEYTRQTQGDKPQAVIYQGERDTETVTEEKPQEPRQRTVAEKLAEAPNANGVREGLLDKALEGVTPEMPITDRSGESLAKSDPTGYKHMMEISRDLSKKGSFNKEQAQVMYDQIAPRFQQYAIERANQMYGEWSNELKNDPVLGGDNIGRTAQKIQSVVQRFGNQGMVTLANTFKFLEYPDMARFMCNVYDAMNQDTNIVTGNVRAAEQQPEKELHGTELLTSLYRDSTPRNNRR